MLIHALGERAIVRCDKSLEQKTEAGLIIPDVEKALSTGVVLSLGRGIITVTGFLIEPEVKKGDRIIFQKRDGALIDPMMFGLKPEPADGDVYLIPQTSIHATIDAEKPIIEKVN